MKGGISPRKAMASGMKKAAGEAISGGTFGMKSYESMHGAPMHPDVKMGHAPMADNSRGVGMPVMHGKASFPSQAAPDHGMHRAKKY